MLVELAAGFILLGVGLFAVAGSLQAEARMVRSLYEETAAQEVVFSQMELLAAGRLAPREGAQDLVVDLPSWANLREAACRLIAIREGGGRWKVTIEVTWSGVRPGQRRVASTTTWKGRAG